MLVRTAAFCNLGCKVNAYETEAMEELLSNAGYTIVPFDAAADVYVVNTCSVTNIADRKSRQMLHRARRRNPDAVIVAAGCYVQTHEDRDTPADIIIGNGHKKEIASVLSDYFEGRGALHKDQSIGHDYEELEIQMPEEHTRAFIKIQDGCSQFCSYCVIPYARGRVRSRSAELVMAEVNRLSKMGYREIVLTGIHLSSYGTDFNGKQNFPGESLLKLVREMSLVPGISRIRLGSLEPRIITPSFTDGLAEIPELCPHFHLSLQSGSDRTLKAMNRHYTGEEYKAGCALIREKWPQAALTTDIIVGFPGETDADFEESLHFVESIHFFETHIFKYSLRQGTRAASLPDQLPESVKEERSRAMLVLNEQNRRAYLKSFIHGSIELLLEEEAVIDGRCCMTGHSREYIHAAVPCDASAVRLVKGSIITAEPLDFLNAEMLVCNIC